MCYVETKNLDGETNLKHKQASKSITKHCDAIIDGSKLCQITCEKENESIYTFQGLLSFVDREGRYLPPAAGEREQEIVLDADQLMLRGSSLRNTEWVIGIAVYCGHDSKVMMN